MIDDVYVPTKPAIIIPGPKIVQLGQPIVLSMLMVNQLAGFGVYGATASTETALVLSGGTLFGNYTTDGGNTSCVDGNTNQTNTQGGSVPTTNTVGYLGYTFPAAHIMAGFRAVGSNDRGFFQTGGSLDPLIRMRVSNGAAPSSTATAQSNGSSLGSGATAPNANSLVLEERSVANSTAYTSVWIWNIASGTAGVNSYLCEVTFYEWL